MKLSLTGEDKDPYHGTINGLQLKQSYIPTIVIETRLNQKAVKTLTCDGLIFVVSNWTCQNGDQIPSSSICNNIKDCPQG